MIDTELKGIDSIINDYSYTFKLLQDYDEGMLLSEGNEKITKKVLEYDLALRAIDILKKNLIGKKEATDLFGQEKTNRSLASILGNVFNSFSWGDAYSSIEEKASHLIYFIIKDHPFNDGNKRIGSFLFLLFLELNNFNTKKDGEKKINDNSLVLLALMIAESDPTKKESYISLLVNLLKDK